MQSVIYFLKKSGMKIISEINSARAEMRESTLDVWDLACLCQQVLSSGECLSCFILYNKSADKFKLPRC